MERLWLWQRFWLLSSWRWGLARVRSGLRRLRRWRTIMGIRRRRLRICHLGDRWQAGSTFRSTVTFFKLDLSGRTGETDVWLYTTGELDTLLYLYSGAGSLLIAE